MRIRKKGEESQEPHKSEVKSFLEGYKAWMKISIYMWTSVFLAHLLKIMFSLLINLVALSETSALQKVACMLAHAFNPSTSEAEAGGSH